MVHFYVHVEYLCSCQIFPAFKLHSDGVIGWQVHGIHNGDRSSQLVQSISDNVLCHTNPSSYLVLGGREIRRKAYVGRKGDREGGGERGRGREREGEREGGRERGREKGRKGEEEKREGEKREGGGREGGNNQGKEREGRGRERGTEESTHRKLSISLRKPLPAL